MDLLGGTGQYKPLRWQGIARGVLKAFGIEGEDGLGGLGPRITKYLTENARDSERFLAAMSRSKGWL